jgi:hypothetical protein
MDQLHERLNALESQVHTLTQHTHRTTRQLRWWRGLACGLSVAGLLGWGLPLGLAREDTADKDKDQQGLAQRVAALEELLKHFSLEKNEIFITGANLHLVNGLGRTDCGAEEEPIPDCPNGLGNLIVGYNEPREGEENTRTGSHNVVVGQGHNFSRFGGMVVGRLNTISGDFAAVSGSDQNTASGFAAVISGGGGFSAFDFGAGNRASGTFAVVSGGQGNTASGFAAVVSGGAVNTASGAAAVVSGGGRDPFIGEGAGNTASGFAAVVSGGFGNTASGDFAGVSGGRNRTAEGEFDWVAGSLVEDE